MSDGLGLLGALGIGLFGSVHCVAMCGGIASAVALGAGPDATAGEPAPAARHRGGGTHAGLRAGGRRRGRARARRGGGARRARRRRSSRGRGTAAPRHGLRSRRAVARAARRSSGSGWRSGGGMSPLAGSLRGIGGARAVLLGALWGWLPVRSGLRGARLGGGDGAAARRRARDDRVRRGYASGHAGDRNGGVATRAGAAGVDVAPRGGRAAGGVRALDRRRRRRDGPAGRVARHLS